MDLGHPPPNPFQGLTPAQRKRVEEKIILEQAYDTRRFAQIEDRERPDFSLLDRGLELPIGLEVTQLFASESHARVHMVHDYLYRLWSGGTHIHKADVSVLNSVTVEITDKEGNVKATNVPAVISHRHTLGDFHARLASVIAGKSELEYEAKGFRHINLAILDWFQLPFNANHYTTDRLFDEQVRSTLKSSPFREILLLITNTEMDAPEDLLGEDVRVIPLQQILAMERMYVTAKIIEEFHAASLASGDDLNLATIDHVARVQGYGCPIEYDGQPYLRYRGTFVRVGADGMHVIDNADMPLPQHRRLVLDSPFDEDQDQRIAHAASLNAFGCGYAPSAYVSPTRMDLFHVVHEWRTRMAGENPDMQE